MEKELTLLEQQNVTLLHEVLESRLNDAIARKKASMANLQRVRQIVTEEESAVRWATALENRTRMEIDELAKRVRNTLRV